MSGVDPSSVARATDDALARVAALSTLAELSDAEPSIVGKRSEFSQLQRSLGALDPEARREMGALLQAARARVEEAIALQRRAFTTAERALQLEADHLDLGDVVVDDIRLPVRAGHPGIIALTQRALEDVFVSMGFQVEEGPEVETDWYNFEALNIPPAHPSRSMWDSFFVDLGEPETVVLRTHTSPTQIHLMERAVREDSLPIHAVMPGRCFRRDTPDARHLSVFHQIEGLVVDEDVTFADLAGTIETFTGAYFGPEIHSRLRPSYFPFTEPSAEFEITCTICHGAGCRTCSQTGWIELGGCGMVDPAVFEAVDIDPERYRGFAFGFGIDRCAQMRHEIADMRALIDNDLRFMRQFS
jgi:phenylalanyl-tRNA synthetase alpha chain